MGTKFELGNLSTWGLLHRIVFTILLFLFVCGAYYYFKGKEQMENINSLETRLQSTLNNYEKEAKNVAELPFIIQEVDELKLVLKETIKNLPTNEEWPSLVNAVYESAKDNGITFEKYQPGNKIEDEYYLIQPIKLEADSGYLNIGSFIEKLTSLDRIMNVESVTLEVESEDISSEVIDVQNLPLMVEGELRTYIFKDE